MEQLGQLQQDVQRRSDEALQELWQSQTCLWWESVCRCWYPDTKMQHSQLPGWVSMFILLLTRGSYILEQVLKMQMNVVFLWCVAVDGNWGLWQPWGECSSSCGGGQRTRVRLCNSPSPSNGGRPCPGDSSQLSRCNTQACPGKACNGSDACLCVFTRALQPWIFFWHVLEGLHVDCLHHLFLATAEIIQPVTL